MEVFEQKFEVPDTAADAPKPSQGLKPIVSVDKYDEILDKMENPNVPVHTISRLISIEIAKATRDMALSLNGDPTLAWKSKAYSEHIKALRELSKQLTETDLLSKKDVLNMDGKKFIWMLAQITGIWKQALKESGCEASMLENTLKHFRDLFVMNESRLRKEVEQVDSSTEVEE